MDNRPSTPTPPSPPDSPETTLTETARSSLADLAALDLPGRARTMAGHDYALLAALRTAHAAHEDVGETIARACARLAAELGGTEQVLANRPGSWEASAVRELLRGTVGPDDEELPASGGAGGSL
jgi:glyoxylase-like metal-dependent hydrolase (beta-lactamase superfamily II)